MEWDSKLSFWDFSEELEENVEQNKIGSVGAHTSSGIDCSVDLRLGGLGEFKSSMPSNSTSSPSASKRARPPGNAVQNALCSVDGCRADLSNCRDYHRKHKVCEAHSKTPVVLINGQQQRFCQQCSRFHSLVEFDDVKRSCRKRLDGHNRRRRKPQPESIDPAILFPNTQGTSFLTFTRMSPTSLSEPNSGGGIIKTEETSAYASQLQHASGLQPHFASSFVQEREFPFLQDNQIAFASPCQPLLDTITSTESKYFPDRQNQAPDSDCALSLLSSQSHSSGITMAHILQAERVPIGQPQSMVSALEYGTLAQFRGSQVPSTGFSCLGEENAQAAAILVTDSEANVRVHSAFDVGGVGSSDGGSSSVPFSWQ